MKNVLIILPLILLALPTPAPAQPCSDPGAAWSCVSVKEYTANDERMGTVVSMAIDHDNGRFAFVWDEADGTDDPNGAGLHTLMYTEATSQAAISAPFVLSTAITTNDKNYLPAITAKFGIVHATARATCTTPSWVGCASNLEREAFMIPTLLGIPRFPIHNDPPTRGKEKGWGSMRVNAAGELYTCLTLDRGAGADDEVYCTLVDGTWKALDLYSRLSSGRDDHATFIFYQDSNGDYVPQVVYHADGAINLRTDNVSTTSVTPLFSAGDQPFITRDTDGSWHVVWEDTEIKHGNCSAGTPDDCATASDWLETPGTVSAPNSNAWHPNMAIVKNSDGDRLGVVTYDQDDERIHFSWRCKGAVTWTRELIDNTADFEWTMWGSPSMVVDRNNEKINVAYLQMDLGANIAKVRWAQRNFPTCN